MYACMCVYIIIIISSIIYICIYIYIYIYIYATSARLARSSTTGHLALALGGTTCLTLLV